MPAAPSKQAQVFAIATKGPSNNVHYNTDESGASDISRSKDSSNVMETQSSTSNDAVSSSSLAHEGSVVEPRESLLEDRDEETHGIRGADFALGLTQFEDNKPDFQDLESPGDNNTMYLKPVNVIPHLAWTPSSGSIIHTEPDLSVMSPRSHLDIEALGSPPSLAADFSPGDEEQSVACLDSMSYETPVTLADRAYQQTQQLHRPMSDSGSSEAVIALSSQSNHPEPIPCESHTFSKEFRYSALGIISEDEEDPEFWMSVYSDGTPHLDDEHLLVQFHRHAALDYLLFVFKEQFPEYALRSRQNGTDASNFKTSSSSTTQSATNQDCGGTGQKRKRRSEEEQQGLEDKLEGVVKKRRIPKAEKKKRLLLACPFVKKDPLHYRACYKQVITKISYVKQHLSRHHRTPIYCPVCMEDFENEEDRNAHTQLLSCQVRPRPQWEGVSETQKRQLQKKVPTKMSEKEQWFTIWDVIFPELPRPQSPYIDSELSEELLAFKDFATSQGSEILVSYLRDAEYAPELGDQSHELPTFLGTLVADGLQIIFERYAEARETESQRRALLDLPEASQRLADNQDNRSSSNTFVDDLAAAEPAPLSPSYPVSTSIAPNAQTMPDRSTLIDPPSDGKVSDYLAIRREDAPHDEDPFDPAGNSLTVWDDAEIDRIIQSWEPSVHPEAAP